MSLKQSTLMVAALSLTLAAGGTQLKAQGGMEAKDIYREGKKTGVKVTVFRGAGGDRRRVPSDYDFRSGDPLELELEANQKSYVYVLNRTLRGDPSQLGARGIDRIRDDDRSDRSGSRAKYTLLYPLDGDPQTTTANKAFKIGGMKMDANPGVEKVMVVMSAKPVDLKKYFDVQGQQRERQDGRPPSDDRRADSADDVLDQLNKDLAEWAGNAAAQLPKGVVREPEGYGVVRDGGKPAMVELSLRHVR